jgi:hypothetical protein
MLPEGRRASRVYLGQPHEVARAGIKEAQTESIAEGLLVPEDPMIHRFLQYCPSKTSSQCGISCLYARREGKPSELLRFGQVICCSPKVL